LMIRLLGCAAMDRPDDRPIGTVVSRHDGGRSS
jgi:hypothetical protein